MAHNFIISNQDIKNIRYIDMKKPSDLNTRAQSGKMKRNIKKAIHFISDKEQSFQHLSDGFIQHIKDLIEFSQSEMDNYFDNVTIRDTRINLY